MKRTLLIAVLVAGLFAPIAYAFSILGIQAGGTGASSFTNGQPVSFNGTSLVSTTTLIVTSASSTYFSASTYFSTASNALVGIASSTPSPMWGVSFATSTVFQQGQLALSYASSTNQSSVITIDWNTGNTQRFFVSASTTFVFNATSSHPLSGGPYILKICQDAVGGHPIIWGDTAHVSWDVMGFATTTGSTTPNQGIMLGMNFDDRTSRYDVLASSTIPSSSCRP